MRRGMKLLDAAGWNVVDGMRRNAAGETLRVEFLDDSPTFQRIIGPYIENLKKMGVDGPVSSFILARSSSIRLRAVRSKPPGLFR